MSLLQKIFTILRVAAMALGGLALAFLKTHYPALAEALPCPGV